MSLQEEINVKLSEISRDSYPMSVGELINLYRDEEMDIHPEFQRVFRWNNFQKTRLIESIMLNIPIPPIFVSQSSDGTWDVIDGVQRLSTIFQFVNVYKDEKGNSIEPLVLEGTEYLPSLQGVMWKNDEHPELSFTREQQLYFKRARIDIIIMKKESDPTAKYELFQRLNTGGTKLSEQEVRNCLMIMTNRSFYDFIIELGKNADFHTCLPISERRVDEQYRLELILRAIIPEYIDWNRTNQYGDLTQLLDKETIILCKKNLDKEEIKKKFEATFSLLNKVLGEDVFKKYNGKKHSGPVMTSAYQAIATGIYSNIDSLASMNNIEYWLKEKIEAFYDTDEFKRNTAQGVKPIARFKDLSLFGKEYLKNEN